MSTEIRYQEPFGSQPLEYRSSPEDVQSTTDDYLLLPGTGFNIPLELAMLVRDYQLGKRDGKNSEELIREWLQKVRQNTIGCTHEYLDPEPVLANDMSVALLNGRSRLISPRYSTTVPISNMFNPLERGGKMLQTFCGAEEALINGQKGKVVIIGSPQGASGISMKHQDGSIREIKFPHTQYYVFRVQGDGDIRGYTTIVDMPWWKQRQVQARFGLKYGVVDFLKDLVSTPRSRSSRMVDNVMQVPAERDFSFVDFVGVLRDVSGRDRAVTLNSPFGKKVYTHSDLQRLLLKSPEELQSVDQSCEEQIGQFEQQVLGMVSLLDQILMNLNIDVNTLTSQQLQDLAIRIPVLRNIGTNIGKMVLAIQLIRNHQDPDTDLSVSKLKEAHSALQKVEGCNGGGESENGESGDCEPIRCRKCGWTAKPHHIELIKEGRLTRCPDCGAAP